MNGNGRRIAFVVNGLDVVNDSGNVNGPSERRLEAGKRDCATMFEILTNKEYGECDPSLSKLVPDCGGKMIFEKKLCGILEIWSKSDVLVLYYSGHGESIGDQFYLVLGKSLRDYYPFDALLAEIKKYSVKSAIIILDACYSGTATKGEQDRGEKGFLREISLPKPHKGYAILASSREYERSCELSNGMASVFTCLFCEGIKKGLGGNKTSTGLITVQDIISYIERRLKDSEYSSYEQTPKMSISEGEGTIWISHNVSNNGKGAEVVEKREDVSASQEPVVDLDGLDVLTRENYYDEEEVASYRNELRDDQKKRYEGKSNREFLGGEAFLKGDRLTLLGVLLFGREGSGYVKMAKTLCSVYGDKERSETAKRKADFTGHLHRQIQKAIDFVLNIEYEEVIVRGQAQLVKDCRYPELCVREVIANAICHRDYKEAGMSVQVRLFPNRIEVGNPGGWYARELEDGVKYSLDELVTEAKQRGDRIGGSSPGCR